MNTSNLPRHSLQILVQLFRVCDDVSTFATNRHSLFLPIGVPWSRASRGTELSHSNHVTLAASSAEFYGNFFGLGLVFHIASRKHNCGKSLGSAAMKYSSIVVG